MDLIPVTMIKAINRPLDLNRPMPSKPSGSRQSASGLASKDIRRLWHSAFGVFRMLLVLAFSVDIGALRIRIGFWCIVYYK